MEDKSETLKSGENTKGGIFGLGKYNKEYGGKYDNSRSK